MPSILKHLWTTIHILFKFTWWNEPMTNKGLCSLHLECSHLKHSHLTIDNPYADKQDEGEKLKESKAGWRSSHHPHPSARPSPSSRNGRNTTAPWSAPSVHTIIPPNQNTSSQKKLLRNASEHTISITSFHLCSCMPGGRVWIWMKSNLFEVH